MDFPVEDLSRVNRSILAVDDEPLVLSALRRELESAQYQVDSALGAEEALDLMRHREFALVISDNIMPGMCGLELLSIVMDLHPHSRRILVTGYTDSDQAIEAFNQGILHRYMQKPWKHDALHAMVKEEWESYQRARREEQVLQELEAALQRRTNLVEAAVTLLKRAEKELGQSLQRQPLERKLAVILLGDVVGFSRLMGKNHEQTLRTLTEYRDVVLHIVRQYHGRLVNAVGDSMLAEFPSAIDAVVSAIEIQAELRHRNEGLPESRRMQFRFGINIGDVLVKGGDLFGDGVNVTARLQSLASPGGICISEPVYRHVRMRLPYQFQSLGEQQLKNIAEPVQVYQVWPPLERVRKAGGEQ